MTSDKLKPQDFLLEIGCEELPAEYLPQAMFTLMVQARALLDSGNGYRWRQIEAWATLRRLALIVRELEPRVRWEEFGPPVQAAYDGEGRPTPAAVGFARSQKVAVERLEVKETSKGHRVVAIRNEPVVEHLPNIVRLMVKGVRFPKRMRWLSSAEMTAPPSVQWETGAVTFARPIRWVVALYGPSVVPCRIAGLAGDRITLGLRRRGERPISIPRASAYLDVMRRAGISLERWWQPLTPSTAAPGELEYVSPDPNSPKKTALRNQLESAAKRAGGRLGSGEEFDWLLMIVAFLTEQPVVVTGHFRKEYLTLPPEVLATAMAKYLKVFSLRDRSGRALPAFLAVLEGRPTDVKGVVAHYERILEARFTDAQFFWREDTKTRLEDKRRELAGVVFHQRLGTLEEKIARMEALAKQLGVGEAPLVRAIRLAKADLVTQMVKEFPTLQGAMGAEYARGDGEPAEVVAALREQYQPRTASDAIPTSMTGAWASVLDRVDTLTGYFGIGLQPTSSEDPYGLRRQAVGLVRILVEKPISLSLDRFLTAALELWGSRLTAPQAQCRERLAAFLLDRFRWWASEVRRFPRELVEAVVAASTDDLADAARRLRVLHELWQDPRQREKVLFTAGKVLERAGRIVAQAVESPGAVDPERFTAPEERMLWNQWISVKAATAGYLKQRDYRQATMEYGKLYPQIHQFFTKVFVMDEDLQLRRNRLALMQDIYGLYANAVGDLSKLPLPTEVSG